MIALVQTQAFELALRGFDRLERRAQTLAIFGFQLGTWFSVAMIGFAGVAVLYDTSNIIHNFPEDRYVAAAMQLFASIALMFWYVLRLVMGSRN